jgi:hypothetical protein
VTSNLMRKKAQSKGEEGQGEGGEAKREERRDKKERESHAWMEGGGTE